LRAVVSCRCRTLSFIHVASHLRRIRSFTTGIAVVLPKPSTANNGNLGDRAESAVEDTPQQFYAPFRVVVTVFDLDAPTPQSRTRRSDTSSAVASCSADGGVRIYGRSRTPRRLFPPVPRPSTQKIPQEPPSPDLRSTGSNPALGYG